MCVFLVCSDFPIHCASFTKDGLHSKQATHNKNNTHLESIRTKQIECHKFMPTCREQGHRLRPSQALLHLRRGEGGSDPCAGRHWWVLLAWIVGLSIVFLLQNTCWFFFGFVGEEIRKKRRRHALTYFTKVGKKRVWSRSSLHRMTHASLFLVCVCVCVLFVCLYLI